MARRKKLTPEHIEKISAGMKETVRKKQMAAGPDTPNLTNITSSKKYRKEDPKQAIIMDKVFERWPQDDDELHLFVQAVWGFRIPRTAVCPGHSAPFDAFAEAFFARSPVTVWKASRGFGGKTMQLALLCLTEALCLGCGVTILGGSGAQSINAHRSTDSAWQAPNAPRETLTKSTTFDTQLSNGAWIRSLTASETSVRGPHPLRLRLDEIDEMDLQILQSAQGQPMRDRLKPHLDTQTVMSSTHQYPDKTMTAILKRAKENDWPVHEWCYRESSNPKDGWLTEQEVDRKRKEITAAMWRTEYDLQEPSFAGRAIDSASVDACFDPHYGEYEGSDQETVLVESPGQYDNNRFAPYVTAVDWAKENDYTIVATFRTDSLPWRCVAWKRYRRVPWPNAVNRAVIQWRNFGGKFIHDQTGLGGVIDDYIQATPMERSSKTMQGLVIGSGMKKELFNEYIAAIEGGHVLYPRINYAYDEHRYVTENDLFGSGHTPDSFVAGALAWSLHPPLHQKRNTLAAGPILIGGGSRKSGWAI